MERDEPEALPGPGPDHGENVAERHPEAPRRHLPHPHLPHLRPLPLWLRIALLFVGWLIVLVGVAGLVLPGIQGILTIVVGAAILSVASERAYRAIRSVVKRWPTIHDRLDRFRERVHDKLSRK